jgi:glycosyltransferase involved in cell wall biosynthesis
MGDNFERSFFCQNRKIPRIHLITGAHDDFHNAMSLKSIEDFYQLSGLWLTTEANVSNSCNYYALYNADLGIILAHGYVFEEYKKRFVNKLYTLNNNILGVFSGLKLKTAETRTNNFLFLSGGKQITKGFHLLMEVAKQRKDLSFYVVVPHINDLLLNYYQDLLIPESNVILFKNLRMDSKQMLDIIETCSYSIAPSYVDGLPGGTIEPMSAGLIPIVSKNCGFPDEKFIIEMQDLTSASLHQAIDRVLQLSDAEYVELSNMAKQYALEKYSAENVKIELEDILKSALNGS